MKLLLSAQAKTIDQKTTDLYGIPGLLLMENAGLGVFHEMESYYGSLSGKRVLVVCGKGNNGGDGFVVARQLYLRKVKTRVLLLTAPSNLKGDALINFDIIKRIGVPIQVIVDGKNSKQELKSFFYAESPDILVDALLGTGVRFPLDSFLTEAIRNMTLISQVVAVDIPSGIDCDFMGGEEQKMVGPTAELTITFSAPKPANVCYPASNFSKIWKVVPIGVPKELIESSDNWLNYVTFDDVQENFKSFLRPVNVHKGHFGHLLVVAGSLGKTGAACLTAKAALSSGTGLITLGVPAQCLPIVASQSLEIMTESLKSTETGGLSLEAIKENQFGELLKKKTLVALGPGLGYEKDTVEFIQQFLKECPLPIVLDADGINAFQGNINLLEDRKNFLILTPHPGEFASLLDISIKHLLKNRIELARKFAMDHGLYLILKGHQTVLATPSGQIYLNSTGNPGMATAGSGDVLTGVISGMIAQWLSMPDSKQRTSIDPNDLEKIIASAVFIHGMAGDFAQNVKGDQALTASDLISFLVDVFLKLTN